MKGPRESVGYASERYARSLAEFGTPTALPRSGGWLLARDIPGSSARDAIGCYPILACEQWEALRDDLDSVAGLVSVAAVTDPFGRYDGALLASAFPDVARPFKTHFVADLTETPESFVSKHHQYYARKALARIAIERCAEPIAMLETWCALYGELVSRHALAGIKAFSRVAFAEQLETPGAVMFTAEENGAVIGAHLWLVAGQIAYSHLAAMSPRGYELMAAYGLHSYAMTWFADSVRYLAWGAGAGLNADGKDGLTQFKRGWSNATRTSFFCGRVFDPRAYEALTTEANSASRGYFPAYRAGEFR